MSTQIRRLEARIEKVKHTLLALGDIRPGSLSTQYNVCGKAGCRCKADPPDKHGPYYQVSFMRQGKHSSTFVRAEHLTAVKRELRNYQRMRTLVDAWIDTGLELAKLRVASEDTKKHPKGR